MKRLFILFILFFVFSCSVFAQLKDTVLINAIEKGDDENRIASFQFHQTAGILQNQQSESMLMLTTAFSFGGKFRLQLAPAFLIQEKPIAAYLMAGIAAQHQYRGLLIESTANYNIHRNANRLLQLGIGMGIPLSKHVLFKCSYTSQYANLASFSGNTFHVGIIILDSKY
jgi:outer membrane biogenesis lipoprotein LolB